MRHLLLLVLVGGILLRAVHAEAASDSPEQSEYFPLAPGNQWVYSVHSTILDSVIGQDTISIDGVAEFDGETIYYLSTPWFPIRSVWVSPDEVGDLYWCDSPGGTEYPLLLFSDAGWGGWLLGGRHCADSATRTECFPPIVTPMGSFSDVVCMTSAWRPFDCDAYWRGTFASDVGPVEWVMMSTAGAALIWQLVEFIPVQPTACKCHGDPVCDGIVDIRDVVKTIDVAFRGAPPLLDRGCSWYARSILGPSDVDCSGRVDIIDVISIIDVVLRGADPRMKFCNPNMP